MVDWNLFVYFVLSNCNHMTKIKTSTILTRGVPLSKKKKLKRIAKDNGLSVNFLMLHAIDYYLDHDGMVKKWQESRKENELVNR